MASGGPGRGFWLGVLGALFSVAALLFALLFHLPGPSSIENAAAVGDAIGTLAMEPAEGDASRRAALVADVDKRLALLKHTLRDEGHEVAVLQSIDEQWQRMRSAPTAEAARTLLPATATLTHDVSVAVDESQNRLEIGVKLLVGALVLLLFVPAIGLVRQRRFVKASLSQFSDDLGSGDWQDAVQALREDTQGPPSAFDALATGVAGVMGESDRRWRMLADLSADWYWETDREHRLVRLFGSVGVLTALGWQVEDVVGWRHDQIAFFRAPGGGGWDAFHQRLDGSEALRDIEFEIISRDRRSLRAVAISGRSRTDARGEFAGYEGVGRDITDSKLALARLQASEQRWAAMVALASDWYWETDEQHRMLPLAPEVQRRFGAFADLVERRTRWEAHPDAMSAQEWVDHRADLEARRPFRSLLMRIDDATKGTTMWLSLSGVPRFDAAKRFRGYQGVGRDITARKEAERVLMRHNEELQRAVTEHTVELRQVNLDLDAFARQLAHELRTPIGHVQGLAHLLQTRAMGRLTDEDRHLLDMQVQSAGHMRETVEALLQLARSTMQPMPTQDVDVSVCATEVIAGLPQLTRAAPVRWEVQPGIRASASLGPLRIVLANLLGNAAKFTRRAAEAEVLLSATIDDNGRVRIAIQDNGVGFDPAQAGRLFTPFGRLHAGDDYHGTGIGLTIVQRIVERHGGTVQASAEKGHGARFEFTLAPASRPTVEPPPAVRDGGPAGDASLHGLTSTSGATGLSGRPDRPVDIELQAR